MDSNTEPLPFGKGTELSREAEKLLALTVDNEVYWVNPNFPHFPGKLVVGQPSKFAFQFLPYETPGKEGNLEVNLPHHRRSGLLGRLIFEDNQGNKYRDLDVKGIGAIDRREKISVVPFELKEKESAPIGLDDLACAKHDVEIEAKLRQIGVRTCPTVAVILLKELIDGRGNKISIEEAKRQGMINPERIPVVTLRAFVTKTRLIDLANSLTDKDTALPWEDTLLLVGKETGQKMTKEAYYYWLAGSLGEQIGKMHFAGFVHNYLSLHNITADARIVDFDSVVEYRKDSQEARDAIQKDRNNILLTLEKMVMDNPELSEQKWEIVKKAWLKGYYKYFHFRKNQAATEQT